MDEPTQLVQIAAYVSADLADEIKARAKRHERSVAAEIRLALREWLDRSEAAAS